MSLPYSEELNNWIDLPAQTPASSPRPDLRKQVQRALSRAQDFLFSMQRPESHWCAELESNPTITAEYIFICQMLGLQNELVGRGLKMRTWLLREQNQDGSWGIAHCWDGDISTTAEVYLALRILGLPADHPALLRAERYIRRHGGLEKIRIFTRIFFAMFGLIPWKAIPAIPAETILLRPDAPINTYALSSWARGTMVPLFIISHHRPIYALPNGRNESNPWLDHLWLNPQDKNIPYCPSWIRILLQHGTGYRTWFGAADRALKVYERVRIPSLRKSALEKCTQWVLDRQEETGDWAGIFPPMINGVLALTLQGYSLDSEPVRKGLEAIHRFSWEDGNGQRIQACVSPIWDTVLSTIGLLDSGIPATDERIQRATQWVIQRQLLVDYGDWKVYRPELLSGGWSFEYSNSWYPDIDDTAAVLLALLKQDPASASSETVSRAVEWTLGMQNRDGGWAAFDVDNDKSFLNEIPFSDMESLCDPSSPDVTGRVLEAFGLLLEISPNWRDRLNRSCERAIAYLRNTQELQGSWFGRWGVNYIYGTSNVLCGLSRLHFTTGENRQDPMILHALDWLRHVQNHDGGWGESIASYADKRWMGRGVSTASQTAWALMALLAFLPPEDEVIQRGVHWLVSHQSPARPMLAYEGGVKLPSPKGWSWEEEQFTGTGFPNHFYLRYHFYQHYFPMMALGRYLKAFEN